MANTMLTSMLLMTVASWVYAFAVVFVRTRAIILEREKGAVWVLSIQDKSKSNVKAGDGL
jgi:heme exporter protein C